MRKEGIDKNHPSSQQFMDDFETIRHSIDYWTNDQDTNTSISIIRRQRSGVQGTIEAMQAVLPCIKNGCLADPWDMAAMHMDTHLQKKTGLQVLVVIASV